MKKKFLTVLFTAIACLCLCLGLTACNESKTPSSGAEQGGGNNTQTEQGGGQGGTHVHVFEPYSHRDATCTQAGEDVLKCECGEEQHSSIPAVGHSYENGVCSVCGSVEGLVAFRNMQVNDDDTAYGKVSNKTQTFSFIQEIVVADDVTFTVSYDLGGKNTIPSKTVSLEIGNNTYYVLASRGNLLKLYTVTVRRRPVYNVNFSTSGSAVSSQRVEEDQDIVQPSATARTGYTFRNWTLNGNTVAFPYTAEEGIPQTSSYNVTFTAVFTANDYKATFDANGGQVTGSEQTVTFDQNYNFPVPSRTGYTFTGWYEGENQLTNATGESLSAWKYSESKQIEARWSANSYQLTVEGNLSDAGTVTGGGSFAYDSDVTVTATTNKGYNFLGWYNEKDERLSEQESYTFPMGLEQTITAKWQVASEMENFIFTSTSTTCTISGLKDKAVTEIIISDCVTSIGASAFYGCSSLQSVTIGSGVTSIGTSAFEGCTMLESVIWNAENCTTAGSDYYPIFNGCTNLKTVTFGENVKNIPSYVFYNRSELTGELKIPDSVTSIGDYAFKGCSGLKNATIQSGAIGDYAFYNCSGLMSVTIGSGVTSIGSDAFYNCSGLMSVTIGSGVTSIGSDAFLNCSGLMSVTIGSGVTSIGDYAFYGCLRLIEVWNYSELELIEGDSGNGSIAYYAIKVYTSDTPSKRVVKDDYLFYEEGEKAYLLGYVGESTELTLPTYSPSGNNYAIWQYAFSGCSGLQSVTIGSGVTSIGIYAFSGCSGLQSVTIGSGVTSIGIYAFSVCSGLESVIWNAENCTTAGSGGYPIFSGCTNLKTVTFGENVKTIPANAFYDCSGLESVTIGAGVTSIGRSAFSGCSGLKTVYYKGTPSGWNGISISSYNNSLPNATRYYYSAQTPTAEQWEESPNWWHYDEDDETIILWTKEQA